MLFKRCKGHIDLTASTGVSNEFAVPMCGRPVLCPQRKLGSHGADWVNEHGYRAAAGTNSRRSSSVLAASSRFMKLTPVRLPPGRGARYKPTLHGSSAAEKTMGMVMVADLLQTLERVLHLRQ